MAVHICKNKNNILYNFKNNSHKIPNTDNLLNNYYMIVDKKDNISLIEENLKNMEPIIE